MYELKHLKGNTYYIDGPTNIGLYKFDNDECAIIDTGTVKEGEIIYKVLIDNNLSLKYIINTHCHVDHTGSNEFLQKKTGCIIITSKIEKAFMCNNEIDLATIYGADCINEFKRYALNTENNKVQTLELLPKQLEYFDLPGHHMGMIGIKTIDDVYFIADAVCGENMVNKENILYVYDLKAYLESIEKVKKFNGNIIVPSHSNPTFNIDELAGININKVNEIISLIMNYIKNKGLTLEDIVANVYSNYGFKPSYNRYFLCTAVIRSYLTYLINDKKIKSYFKDNKLIFEVM